MPIFPKLLLFFSCFISLFCFSQNTEANEIEQNIMERLDDISKLSIIILESFESQVKIHPELKEMIDEEFIHRISKECDIYKTTIRIASNTQMDLPSSNVSDLRQELKNSINESLKLLDFLYKKYLDIIYNPNIYQADDLLNIKMNTLSDMDYSLYLCSLFIEFKKQNPSFLTPIFFLGNAAGVISTVLFFSFVFERFYPIQRQPRLQ